MGVKWVLLKEEAAKKKLEQPGWYIEANQRNLECFLHKRSTVNICLIFELKRKNLCNGNKQNKKSCRSVCSFTIYRDISKVRNVP